MTKRSLGLPVILLANALLMPGWTLAGELATAIDAADLARVRALAAAGRALEERGRDGKTALMVAARAGDAQLVGELIAAGEDVEHATTNGGTALMFAAYSGNPSVVRGLLAAGAKVDRAGGFEWTPLSVAAVKGRARVIEALLAHGADPNHRDVYAWTPIMRAISNGHIEAARALLAHGRIDLGLVDELGWGAVHHAARLGDAELLEALIERGTDVTVRNGDGVLAVDLARLAGHSAAVAILEAALPPQ